MSDKLLKKALARHKAGRRAEARQLYRKLLKADPRHLDGHYLLGTLLAEEGDLEGARRHLEQARALAPDSPWVLNNLGNVHRLAGRLEEAAACYEAALAAKPDLAEACNNLGTVRRRLGDEAQAAACYERALALRPGFADAAYNLGKLHLDAGRVEDAAACFARALDADPRHAPALFGQGRCHLEKGEAQAAADRFRRYLEAAGEDRHGARLYLARLGEAETPARLPEALVRETYALKAARWDERVADPEMAFLGPAHVEAAVGRCCPEAHELDVLDLGCGTGLCGPFLRPLARRLVGVDLSGDMLALARDKGLYDALEESEALDYLRRHREAFHLVAASGLVIFFGDLRALVGATAAALRPGGAFVFTTYRSAGSEVEVRANAHFGHSRAHLEAAAAHAGLAVEALEEVVHEYEGGRPQPGYVVTLRRSA